MQAMVAAHEYGFEVLDDTLYMFSPLYQADLQIPDMEKKIMPVRKVLQDAAMAYQAKHQALTDSDEVGSQLDRHLKRSQLNNALVAVGMLVLAGWYLYYEITN
jgi:hypothetical protein